LYVDRRRGQVGKESYGLIANGLTTVIEDGNETRDAHGGDEDTFFGTLGASRENGSQQLERVEAGVKIGRLEKVEKKCNVFLTLGEFVGQPKGNLGRSLGAVLVGAE
jgi:hypothetical protein